MRWAAHLNKTLFRPRNYVLLLAPVSLQIVHLFGADVLWILLVLASADLMLDRANTYPVGAVASGV